MKPHVNTLVGLQLIKYSLVIRDNKQFYTTTLSLKHSKGTLSESGVHTYIQFYSSTVTAALRNVRYEISLRL